MKMRDMTKRVAEAISSPIATASFRVFIAIVSAFIALGTYALTSWANNNYTPAAEFKRVREELGGQIDSVRRDSNDLERQLIRIEERQKSSTEQISRVLDRVDKIGDRLGVPASK